MSATPLVDEFESIQPFLFTPIVQDLSQGWHRLCQAIQN